MDTNIKLSIVMAYYNRKALLLRTLESIKLSSKVACIEVIIVDDASSEENRLENIVQNYSFPIKLVRIEPKDKKHINPCVPYNLGFKEAKGEVIIIQNPECLHFGDIINYTLQNISNSNYLAFATYALSKEDTLALDESEAQIKILVTPSCEGNKPGWYNHSQINPRPLHFTTAITRSNLLLLGGFDERYADGIGYDDDELLYRIRALRLQVVIVDSPFVLHQNHYNENGANSFEEAAIKSPNFIVNNSNLFYNETLKTKKLKIVGFSQLHNELELGNLENWFKCMGICDEIYIYDQASTDGSKEYYKQFSNVHVIESSTNRFKEELICKGELLEKVLKEHPDVDWIFWIDGDTILDGRLLHKPTLRRLLLECNHNNIDGIALGHYNLWRSDVHYRIDDGYHSLMDSGRIVFWKNNGNLHFPKEQGLHKRQEPLGMSKIVRLPCNLIHRGFATDAQIIKKYANYKSQGQNGWALERLLSEKTLDVKVIHKEELPTWYQLSNTESPKSKKPLIQIYEEKYRINIPNI